jgi:cytochrome c
MLEPQMAMPRRLITILLPVVLCVGPAAAQLRGHGGPVRAIAVAADGQTAVSGSFDTSAIRWSLQRNTADQVLRFHDGAVNAVAILPDGRIATGGADARIAIWQPGAPQPQIVFEGHGAPVAGLAVSPDGETLASASWDRTVRLWPLSGGNARLLNGHQQNVNAVAFLPDGKAVVSAGYDATLRIWPLRGDGAPIIVTLPTPLNAVVVAPDSEILCAGADGKVYVLSGAGELRATIAVADSPIIALAISRDGARVAAAGMRGAVAIIARSERTIAQTLVGPGLPVWAAAFLPDNHTLLTGGADRTIRRWDAATGEPIDAVAVAGSSDPLTAYAGDAGAEIFRACVACHSLRADEGVRAGPTLAGLMGRRIATASGYNFSPALKKLDIVWTPETVAKLFELGPATYTPGTKMPEQKITSAADRAALVQFLEKATK